MKNNLLISLVIILSACTGLNSEMQVQTAIAETQFANPTSTLTPNPTATFTSTPTLTPSPTATQIGSGLGKILFIKSEKTSNANEFIDNICSVYLDGSNLTCLTNNKLTSSSYARPTWSSNGEKILFSKSEKVQLNSGADNWISEIFVMNSDGSGIQKISPSLQFLNGQDVTKLIYDEQGQYSPDGNFIAFSSNRHALLSTFDKEIYIMNTNSFEITQLTFGYGESFRPSWSPDGSKIAFNSNRDGDWEIYTMNVDGSGITQLTKNSYSDRFPDWSPDGSKIAYHSDRDGNVELYTISVIDMVETRITHNPAIDATASWSPDGMWLAFYTDRAGKFNIFITNLDETVGNQLTTGEFEYSFADWSP